MKVKLKSKLGRSFWRFGVKLAPDSWTELDLTEEELASIRAQCEMSVAQGGALEIEPNPWVKASAPPVAPPPAGASKEDRGKR